ncbi:MAG TPA: calcium-binding protein, partial [Ramlibacter sp.]|nr:calcium-binding protein [Ramlibacter sp.]
MALLEVLSVPLIMHPAPDIVGTPSGQTDESFQLSIGTDTIEFSGFGFIYDMEGEPIAGTVTAIDWIPSGTPLNDFTLTGISWDISADVADTGFKGMFGAQAEWAYWLDGDDTIWGSEERDVLVGYFGDDYIEGRGGNDALNGWDGNDTILGGAGSDYIHAGNGSDLIDGGVVTDHLNYTDGNTASWQGDTSDLYIDLTGITGDGSIGTGVAYTSTGVDVLRNINFIRAGEGNDYVLGSSAETFEMIEGGGGNDTLDGGQI